MKALYSEIPKRTAHCAEGKEAFVTGMSYYSTLLEEENKKNIRKDYCSACWSKNQRFPYWKGRVELKKKEIEAGSDKNEKALNLLLESLGRQDLNSKEHAFILALFLARRKKLYLRGEIQRESEIFSLYEVAATEDLIEIPKLKVTALQIERIQGEIAAKLGAVS